MITLLMIIALAWQFYLGYSRGLVKQTYLLIALVISILVAKTYYKPLAGLLTFWVPYTQAVEEKVLTYFPQVSIFEMDKVFYAGTAFLALTLASYFVLRLLTVFLHFFPLWKLDTTRFNVISGALSVFMTVVFWSMALRLFATVPFDQVQRLLTSNPLISLLINFPVLSNVLNQLWVG
ncbi:CvpA family protein [Streptococcus entericus]|uniref:CvpA family protein n=1 Tax=Streptococcus entericus TaxID=155680 RepID=UPI00036C57A6|nr:CvpA family protein [Streptococcus entericus]